MKVMHPKMLVRTRVGKKRSSSNLSLALSLQDLTSDSPNCLIMMVFFEEFSIGIGSTNGHVIDAFLYSHHLLA